MAGTGRTTGSARADRECDRGRRAGRRPRRPVTAGPAADGLARLWRRALAEFVGTAFLVAVVVGSGIAAERLSPGDVGLQLLENAAATAAGLVAIILAVGPGVRAPTSTRW